MLDDNAPLISAVNSSRGVKLTALLRANECRVHRLIQICLRAMIVVEQTHRDVNLTRRVETLRPNDV